MLILYDLVYITLEKIFFFKKLKSIFNKNGINIC